MLVVAPTSSGKTLIGEMAAAQIAMTGQRHVFVSVPMKSLAEEHYFRLRERYGDLMNVVISTGDKLEHDEDIRHGYFDLAVLTYEKLAALIVQVPGLLTRCGCVVIDEGQMIADKQRGTDLEVLVTEILLAPSKPRLIVLSASLDELNRLDKWLNAQVVMNSERPVPLNQAVCSAQSGIALVLKANGERVQAEMAEPCADTEMLAVRLALKHAEAGRQVVVFRTAVSKTRSMAHMLAGQRTARGVRVSLNELLLALEDADVVKELADLFASGVAFHNADLSADERRVVEGAFRSGVVRILVSTTTLAMGVNMPADVVIVADVERPVPEVGGSWRQEPIAVAEYRNSAGRAGRLNLRTEGLAILLARDDLRRAQLFRHYLLGPVEPIESQIPRAPLHDLVFRLLAGQVARSEDALVDFVCATYAYLSFYQNEGGPETVRSAVAEAVGAAVSSRLVVDRHGELLATRTAHVLAGSGVGLSTSIGLNNVAGRRSDGEIHAADVVYEIARCPESGNRPYAARNRMHTRWDFRGVRHAHESPLGEAIDAFVQSESEQQALEQTMCLLRWMNGDDTRTLQTDFHMSRERLRGMGGSAAWLLQTLAAAAQAQGADKAQVRFVQDLALKAQHGLPSAMATLAALRPPGVSREALMRLHHLGITSPDDLLEADPISLQEALSPALAQAFKEAIQRETVASLRRKHSGHLHAAGEVGVAPTLIEALYTATGPALEEAVRDAFITAGLHAVRLLHQPHGEEDIQVATETGTVVVSATGSQDDSKPIRWTKAEDVMGQGAGLNPVNCVCVGRPRFESLAEKNANAIAREGGDRKILLMPTDVLAEAVIRCSRGDMTTVEFGDLVATRKGVLTVDDLPSHTGAEEPVV